MFTSDQKFLFSLAVICTVQEGLPLQAQRARWANPAAGLPRSAKCMAQGRAQAIWYLLILVLYTNLSHEEIAMFWAGMIVGLILGAPVGMFVLALMISAKRGQDELDRAVSAMEPTPVR